MNHNIEKTLNLLKGKILFNEPLSKHTWLGVGGPAEIMFFPQDIDDLKLFLQNKPDDVPTHIIGGGANILVRDGGIKGVVIKLDTPYFKNLTLSDQILTCSAGLKNVSLKKFLIEHEIGGLEFLCSIPGTLGGSIKTNAGCFGHSVSDVLHSATIIDLKGNIQTVAPQDFNFSYRSSDFPNDWIIISLNLKTYHKNADEIRKILQEQDDYRKQRQPYNQKTAGSTFKNPSEKRAWELIKQSECENLRIGGAKMSEKHCNFMINTGQATASDCEELGEEIIKRVKEKTGVLLEWEIQRLGQKK